VRPPGFLYLIYDQLRDKLVSKFGLSLSTVINVISGVFSSVYVIIFSAAIAATYYFFDALNGPQTNYLLPRILSNLESTLGSLVNIAKYCTPAFANGIKQFLECIGG
jgi:hypothetical protein